MDTTFETVWKWFVILAVGLAVLTTLCVFPHGFAAGVLMFLTMRAFKSFNK